MKILHLINLHGFGGAERLFIEYLKNSSFTNEIICTSNAINNNIINELAPYQVTYANYIGNTPIKHPAFIRKYILKSKIIKKKPDVTIIWDFIPKLNKKPKKTFLLYYDHGCSWRYPINKKTLHFFNMLDGAISISVASKRIMQLRFNPSFLINIVINRLPITLIKNNNIISKKITLGTASRLVGLKGIGISILFLKKLIESGIDANLIIAGDGEQKKELEHLAKQLNISENIIFSGYQSNMSDFYNKIDIYLSTPVTEPFGLSCIEALSQGVPVIYPMIDGQPEAIKNHYCGLGIQPTLSINEYYKQTGLLADFPHDVYDPINDCLVTPLLIDPHDMMIAITDIINKYKYFSENALLWSKKTTDYNMFINEFESVLIGCVKK